MKRELIDQALARVATSRKPDDLRAIIRNAKEKGIDEVARAAQLQLYSILPSAEPGTLEHDVWQSIHALEDALSSERHKTVRLSRTRQMIQRVGELDTVSSLIGKPTASEGFRMLLERDMLDLTFEAVALRHPKRFDPATLDLSRARLAAADSQD
ncbi:MAG TPA: hypothetical protein PKD99_08375 [Sphingopyxis sp.]|nr:hypothetical protein [Sphingopyxis sp.]HMP45106.1 hypothetical protein [Sphingopyxis sp.]HMQ19366.1 hypothetical protein [Sphingopyxis sp.]